MKGEFHYTFKTKRWWRNMDNRILNYLHMGEDNNMRFIHMNHRCRLDRVAPCPCIWMGW